MDWEVFRETIRKAVRGQWAVGSDQWAVARAALPPNQCGEARLTDRYIFQVLIARLSLAHKIEKNDFR